MRERETYLVHYATAKPFEQYNHTVELNVHELLELELLLGDLESRDLLHSFNISEAITVRLEHIKKSLQENL